jgi:hypothetical protein
MADGVTLGTGDICASDEITTANGAVVSARHAQRVKVDAVGADGQFRDVSVNYPFPVMLVGNRPTYGINIPSQVHVAAANTVHWDLFNADPAVVVRVLSILQRPNITTSVTGVVFDWLLERTTAVGTGGSAITPWSADTAAAALDADITCRSKPTGGATQSTDLSPYSLSSEETNAATIQIASQGGLELLPPPLMPANGGSGLVLRQNQGLRCVQVTNSAAGNTGWLMTFTTD